MPTTDSRQRSGTVPSDAAMGALPILRSAWFQASDLALQRNVTGLRPIVEARLARIKLQRSFDEPSLNHVVDECRAMVAVVAGERAADLVAQRMRRGVYEFLLALDAAGSEQQPAEHSAPARVADPQRPPRAGGAGRTAPPRFATVDIDTVRRHVCGALATGRYQQAAAILTRVSRTQRGTELAAIACAAGVACRTAGEKVAAAACFQASCVADPEYEAKRPRIQG